MAQPQSQQPAEPLWPLPSTAEEPQLGTPSMDDDNDDNNFRIPRLQQNRQAAWFQSSVVRRSSSAVDEAVDELTEKSQFLLRSKTPRTSTTSSSSDTFWQPPPRPNTPQQQQQQQDDEEEEVLAIAPLHREEILVGQVLGEGTFSCVYEVTGIELFPAGHDEHDTPDSDTTPSSQHQLRQDLATAGPGRYALKHLKADLLANTKDFEDAATDLVMEAKYLGALNHPNILKLRGHPIDGTAAFVNRQGGPGHYHDGYFLLTDRLTETLARRIERWKTTTHDDDDILAVHTNTILCKARYALQIAHALDYLHEQRIIFRDLKPSNIGFNAEDQMQLFDFGLCRELPPPRRARPYQYRPFVVTEEEGDGEEGEEGDEYSASMDESWYEDDDDLYATSDTTRPQREEVYFMSGAGTLHYMAPEILLQSRYNLKADVYSWAMTFTEILLLEKPLPWYPKDEHIQFICKEGDRPCLPDGTVPDALRDLLAWAWEGDVSKRCTIAQARQELQDIIDQIEEEEEEDNDRQSDCPLSARVVDAAHRFQEFLCAMLERTLQCFHALFERTRTNNDSAGHTSHVTFEVTATETPAATSVDPEATVKEQESNHQDAASTFPSLPSSSDDHPSPSQTDQRNSCATDSSKGSHAARLWRKRSSTSTTALTDDECDDDMAIISTDSFQGPGAAGGGLHAIAAL